MPKIPVYDAQTNSVAQMPGGNPDRVYADAKAFGGGSGLGTLAGGLEDASTTLYNSEQREEASNVRVQMATMRGQATAEFIEGSAKGDPGFTEKFNEGLANRLATYGGTLNTKAGMQAFQEESASMTSTFLAKGVEHNVAVAAATATSNYHSMINQNAGTLFNDPTQAGAIFKSIDSAFSDPNGAYAAVPAEQRAALQAGAREQLAVAAGRGVAMMNPDMAEKMYKEGHLPGQSYLTEAGNAQIVSYITTQQNAERTKQALAIAQQERQERMASENAQVNILRHIETNPNDPNNVALILKSPMKAPQMMTMLELAKHVGGPDSNHDTNTYGPGFLAQYDAVHAGKVTTPDQLYPLVGKGDLTVAGVNMLTGEMQGKRTPAGQIEADMKQAFVKAMSQQLSGTNELLHLRDPNGDKQVASALAWFLPAYEKAKQDPNFNPSVALDPNNPKSLWSGVMRFKRDPNTMMRDLMAFNPGMPAPEGAPAPAAKPAGGNVVRYEDLK